MAAVRSLRSGADPFQGIVAGFSEPQSAPAAEYFSWGFPLSDSYIERGRFKASPDFLSCNSKKVPKTKTTYYPIALHRLFRTDETGLNFSDIPIEQNIRDLNRVFAPIQIQFYAGYAGVIREDSLFDKGALAPGDFKSYFQDQFLNIVVVDDVKGHAAARAELGVGFVVNDEKGSNLWIHEMGHVFGLGHSHDELSSSPPTKELADGSNSHEAGDLIEDTPADPGPERAPLIKGQTLGCKVNYKECRILSCPKDSRGETYRPDVRNFMSYYAGCQERFSEGQLKKMACLSNVNKLLKRIGRSKPQQSVDLIFPFLTVGCDEMSLPNIKEALNTVAWGGTIEICGGTYEENLTISNSIILRGREGENVVIDGGKRGTVLKILGNLAGPLDVVLENITVQNGWRMGLAALLGNGSGMEALYSDVVLNDVRFFDNMSAVKSPFDIRNSFITLNNCIFQGNEIPFP